MKNIEKISFENKEHEKIVCNFSKNNDSNIIVILSHGLLRGKNKGFIPNIFSMFESINFNVCSLDFAGYEESEGDIKDLSYLKQIDDLESVIKGLRKLGFQKFCLIGHSMGAAVSIMTANKNNLVKWIIDIASPADPEKIKERRFNKNQLTELERKGFFEYELPNGKKFNFYKRFFEDTKKIDIPKSISQLNIPILIIQGSEDESVMLDEAEKLFLAAKNNSTLQIIGGANHNFKKHTDELISTIKNWSLQWIEKE